MRLRTSVVGITIILASASLAIACSVPVFRYALEHWQPDSYVAYVFHDAELTDIQLAAIDVMRPKRADGSLAANVSVRQIDVASDKTSLVAYDKSVTLPHVVVQSPPKWGPPQTVWQGNLTKDNVVAVMDSPARTQIGKRLVDGESVVWVLLECGRAEEDDAVFEVLTVELKKLQEELKLPEVEEEDLGDLSVNPESLRIAFSAIRIARDDPNEQVFVEMLSRVEADLRDDDIASQPMAFPVFGRGRALYALVGKGIAPDVIKEASKFLTGACQCTVKQQNPGVDLIMNVDWDTLVISTEPLDSDLPPLAGFSGFGLPDGQTETVGDDESATLTSTQAADVVNTQADDGLPNEEPVAAAASSADNDVLTPALGTNVLYLLMFLVAAVVFATFVLRPRAN